MVLRNSQPPGKALQSASALDLDRESGWIIRLPIFECSGNDVF